MNDVEGAISLALLDHTRDVNFGGACLQLAMFIQKYYTLWGFEAFYGSYRSHMRLEGFKDFRSVCQWGYVP